MSLAIASPKSTATAEVATSASAEPAKTVHLDAPLADRLKVASCVLSPISARKIAPNVDKKSFQSIPLHIARVRLSRTELCKGLVPPADSLPASSDSTAVCNQGRLGPLRGQHSRTVDSTATGSQARYSHPRRRPKKGCPCPATAGARNLCKESTCDVGHLTLPFAQARELTRSPHPDVPCQHPTRNSYCLVWTSRLRKALHLRV